MENIVSKFITRGRILSLLAVAVTAGCSSADDSGGTKARYKYISRPGPKGQKCSGCSLFKPPAACVVVKGKISPEGYCIAYAAK
jgi:hypothetical protein